MNKKLNSILNTSNNSKSKNKDKIVEYMSPAIEDALKKDKRKKAFEAQLGDTLIMMCNGLRSGFSLAIARAIDEECPIEPTVRKSEPWV